MGSSKYSVVYMSGTKYSVAYMECSVVSFLGINFIWVVPRGKLKGGEWLQYSWFCQGIASKRWEYIHIYDIAIYNIYNYIAHATEYILLYPVKY